MDLAEQQDPEEWRTIMQRFFSILADAVDRFEGTVDKFTGDGIMAVFGAPIAHEDHARRACYAALQMLDDVAEYAAELRRAARASTSRPGSGSTPARWSSARSAAPTGLHGARPHRRPRAADGGAGRARQGLPDRAHRRAGRRLLRPRGPRRVRDQGREPAGPRLRAGRGRRGAHAPRPLARARLLPLRRPRRGDGGARGGARARRAGRGRRGRRRRRTRRRQEPALPRVRRALPRARGRGLRGAGAVARRRRSPSCRCCRCCAPTSASATREPERTAREKIAGRAPAARPRASPTTCRCSSTSSASPTPTGRCRR